MIPGLMIGIDANSKNQSNDDYQGAEQMISNQINLEVNLEKMQERIELEHNISLEKQHSADKHQNKVRRDSLIQLKVNGRAQIENQAVFMVRGNPHVLDKRSLFVFSQKSSIRYGCLWLLESKFFEYFILLIIIANSIDLAVYDYSDRNNLTFRNKVINKMSTCFTIIFLIECLMKIISYGFVYHKKSYVRDGWNVLDLAVVISGIIEFFPNSVNLKALRTLRVLRPLRSINAIKRMKNLVNTLLKSIPNFLNVAIFLLLIFIIFGILGLQEYGGDSYYQCRTTQFPINNTQGQLIWPKDPNSNRLCSPLRIGRYKCPEGTWCGSPYQYGISLENDGVNDNVNINYGIATFDNIGKTLIMEFQVVTQDNWSASMYNMMDTNLPPVAAAYFCLLVIIGGFFLLNLVLAVVLRTFQEVQNDELKNLKQKIAENEKKLELIQDEKESNQQHEDSNLHDNGNDPQGNNKKSVFSITIKPAENSEVFDNKSSRLTDDNQSANVQKTVKKLENSSKMMNEDQFENDDDIENSRDLDSSKIKLIKINPAQLKTASSSSTNMGVQSNQGILNILSGIKEASFDQETEQDKFDQTAENPLMRMRKSIKNSNQNTPQSNKKMLGGGLLSPMFEKQFQKQIHLGINQKLKILTKQDDHQVRDLNVFRKAMSNAAALKNLQQFHNNIQLRQKQSRFIRFFVKIATNNIFSFLISLSIVANTTCLALDKYPKNDNIDQVTSKLNTLFFAIFFSEMVIKMIGLGIRGYASDNFNIFDCIIVIIGVVDIVITYTLVQSDQKNQSFKGAGTISAIRAFRLLRVFKLASGWKKFQQLIQTIGNTLKDISTFTILLFLFMFVYTLVGMELFAYRVAFDDNDHFDLVNGTPRKWNFNTFYYGFITVFGLLTGDGWTQVMFDHYRATNKAITLIYFFSFIIIGQLILLNLFIAILLQNFDEDSINAEEAEKEDKIKSQMRKEKAIKWLKMKKFLCKCFRKRDLSVYEYEEKYRIEEEKIKKQAGDQQAKQVKANNFIKKIGTKNSSRGLIDGPGSKKKEFDVKRNQQMMEGKSLGLFDVSNKFRAKIYRIIHQRGFDMLVVFIILLSSIEIALENPLSDPNGQLNNVLKYLEIFTMVVFCLEAAMKVVAFGLFLNGKGSYLRNYWNLMDFCIIILSILSLLSPNQSSLDLFRVVRLVRIVRPLRVISHNEGLKVSVRALIRAINNIISVTLISLLFFLAFGIIGVNYFKGQFFYCMTTQLDPDAFDTTIGGIKTKWDCLQAGGEWKRYINHFDDIFSAMITLFQVATLDDWQTIMYRGMSIAGYDNVQVSMKSQNYGIYFIIYAIVGGFFILNLFIGVVISNFNRQKEKLAKNFLLSTRQRDWLEIKFLILHQKPMPIILKQNNKFRQFCLSLSKDKKFEIFIMVMIFCNTIVLMLKWDQNPPAVYRTTEILNYCFTAIFGLECIIKLIGQGTIYFSDKWNIFDLIVMLVTFVGIFLSKVSNVQLGPAFTIIRSFRILRIFRVIKRAKSLKIIFQTFIYVLPSMMHIGALLMLLIYIYSVLGMNLYATVMNASPMNDIANFATFGNSFLLMLRMTTCEGWYDLMVVFAQQYSLTYQCKEQPTYDDYVANGNQPIGCGSTSSYVYFISNMLLIRFIFLNAFIAIILDGYEVVTEAEGRYINSDKSDLFREKWAQLDHKATGYIKAYDLPNLLFFLGAPMGWDQSYIDKNDAQQKFVADLKLALYNDNNDFQFYEVFTAVALKGLIEESIDVQLHPKDGEQLPVSLNTDEEEEMDKQMRIKIENEIKEMEENTANIEIVKRIKKLEKIRMGKNKRTESQLIDIKLRLIICELRKFIHKQMKKRNMPIAIHTPEALALIDKQLLENLHKMLGLEVLQFIDTGYSSPVKRRATSTNFYKENDLLRHSSPGDKSNDKSISNNNDNNSSKETKERKELTKKRSTIGKINIQRFQSSSTSKVIGNDSEGGGDFQHSGIPPYDTPRLSQQDLNDLIQQEQIHQNLSLEQVPSITRAHTTNRLPRVSLLLQAAPPQQRSQHDITIIEQNEIDEVISQEISHLQI